ncbi:MAG: sulfotransferase [Desulfovibrionaceae bacterium]
MQKSELWPNFLIIGAGKSGTTSLYHYLKAHPDVFMPEVKEPQFFSGTLPTYASETAYLDLFRGKGNAKVWGEGSVAYLSTPSACSRIHETLGKDVKLICLLRNPVRTIYSRWGQLTKMHLENRPAEEAIFRSLDASRQENPEEYELYALAVDYAVHLERYRQFFPPENLCILFFEEFFREDLPQFGSLCRFLGIDDTYEPENVVHNKGQIWRTTFMDSPLWKKSKAVIAPPLRVMLPMKLRAKIHTHLERWNKKPLDPMSDTMRKELQVRLDKSVRNLEKLLGRDLRSLWF